MLKSGVFITVVLFATSGAIGAHADERTEFKTPDGRTTGYAVTHGNETRVFSPDSRHLETLRTQSDGRVVRMSPEGRTLGYSERR